MDRIDLYQRSYDWMATREGNKGQWESGRTPEEAIKKLHISFPELIGAEVVYKGTDYFAEANALVLEAFHGGH